ncbi:MAG: nucleoside 2-deoxyribosyltransferase [Tissierellia bacterium]|nr:nucleoside 2-deoxyribosyltransferase [Tissierellia bacterium]
MKGYFASHFFNTGMYEWTEKVATYIEKETGLHLYVPQRNDGINDKKNNDATITAEGISKADTLELKKANILIACLDGLTIDDGVAGEIMAHGVMAELEEEYQIPNRIPRRIIGIYTDMRALGTGDNRLYRNQMIVGKIKEHGKIYIGYPGDDSYLEDVVKDIRKFMEENK